MTREGLILKIDCPDRPGLVARIAGYVSDHQGNLVEFNQFTDTANERFFARLEIDTSGLDVETDDFVGGFGTLGRALEARWHFRRLPYRMRTAVLVTRTDHCLNEILWRAQLGEVPVDITSIIGNREDCRSIAEKAGIPFHFVEIGEDKEPGFREIEKLLKEQAVELVVLARFMQVVPGWLCSDYQGRMINIHHSFLPAFAVASMMAIAWTVVSETSLRPPRRT